MSEDFAGSQIHTVFVGDLSIFCNETHIEEAFARFGRVLSVRIAFDVGNQKQLPYGFVEFGSTEHAEEAIKAMNGSLLCGRKLR